MQSKKRKLSSSIYHELDMHCNRITQLSTPQDNIIRHDNRQHSNCSINYYDHAHPQNKLAYILTHAHCSTRNVTEMQSYCRQNHVPSPQTNNSHNEEINYDLQLILFLKPMCVIEFAAPTSRLALT
jgi:hypothetical protein